MVIIHIVRTMVIIHRGRTMVIVHKGRTMVVVRIGRTMIIIHKGTYKQKIDTIIQENQITQVSTDPTEPYQEQIQQKYTNVAQ